ncbi:MAG: tetratricopeptide repeat protein, partial [Methanosarcina sp.]|nr:tetratricopeptide repeat protein [Methanosarcina sp.]
MCIRDRQKKSRVVEREDRKNLSSPDRKGSDKKRKKTGVDREEKYNIEDVNALKELFNIILEQLTPTNESNAQELVFKGMEHLAGGDLSGARRYFKRAIKLAPEVADAYSGLALVARERYKLQEAEEYFKLAYEKARASLGTEDPGAFSWWINDKTRPYLRARFGLALIYGETGRYDEAISELREIIRRNQNDNQGVRYHIAPLFLLKGDLTGALREFEWYEKNYGGDIPIPDYLLNWGLAFFKAKMYVRAAEKFRMTILWNPYLIRLVIGEHPEELPIWHSINTMTLDYAYEYFQDYALLWIGQDEAINFLRFFWEDREIQQDFKEWVKLRTEVKSIKDYSCLLYTSP